ncbi:uncharacterized protein DUF385 [Actinomycetospora succinea]|uniref:Uncharacterized protein DUF385 n=1 Tax=Actinomycetospora succinea TaxID=663603 RepID=A0A4R6V632_9PSEU|nr:nitroreductase/quinone reductase family protein [Actinomycetospora succinea]TDQ53897.1 uncharacterized protein DUF385 [Actinomycetospora succinea]
MSLFQNVAAAVNTVVRPLVTSPRWGSLVSGWMTVVTYTGRRSGRRFTLPVGYRRHGDEVTIGVEFPDRKSWWRNFTGTGAPLAVRLDGVDRPGHGVARRTGDGRVTIDVHLDPVA